jgi:hypothetical protein
MQFLERMREEKDGVERVREERGKGGGGAASACLMRFLERMRGAFTAAPSKEDPVRRMPLPVVTQC